MSDTFGLRGKTGAPHLGKHIEIRTGCGVHEALGFTDVVVGTGPADVRL
jgi:hypothetical protein